MALRVVEVYCVVGIISEAVPEGGAAEFVNACLGGADFTVWIMHGDEPFSAEPGEDRGREAADLPVPPSSHVSAAEGLIPRRLGTPAVLPLAVSLTGKAL